MKRRIDLAASILIIAAADMSPASQNSPVSALELRADAKELALTKGLAVGLIGSYGRSAVPSDLLAWQRAQGTMAEPKEGLVVGKNAKGEDQAWAPVEANKDGWIENRALSGGYLFMVVNADEARTMILDATGFYVGLDQRGAPRRREVRRRLSAPPRSPGQGAQRASLPGRARPLQGPSLCAPGRLSSSPTRT